MKTAIAYYSKHHGNTKKLLDAISAAADVELIDATGHLFRCLCQADSDISAENLPDGKQISLIETCGSLRKGYFSAMEKINENIVTPTDRIWFLLSGLQTRMDNTVSSNKHQ